MTAPLHTIAGRRRVWRAVVAMGLAASVGLVAAAPPEASAASGPRQALLRKLRATDRQWHSLQKRIRGCPAATRHFRASNTLHLRAIRRAARASVKSLRSRNALLSQAVVRLSRGAQICATQARPSGPAVEPPVRREPAPNPPRRVYTVTLTVLNVVDGNTIDVSDALGPVSLPSSIEARDTSRLDDPPCSSVRVVCVGFDRNVLNSALRQVMNQNLLVLLLRNLGRLDVAGITSQLGALLGSGDYASLITVQRVGDRLLRLVPNGPVAQLAGLPVIPSTAIGRVQVIR